jgi:hypothetical protein
LFALLLCLCGNTVRTVRAGFELQFGHLINLLLKACTKLINKFDKL